MLMLIACILQLVPVAFGCQRLGQRDISAVSQHAWYIVCVIMNPDLHERRWQEISQASSDRQTDRVPDALEHTHRDTHSSLKISSFCKSEMGGSMHHFRIHEITFIIYVLYVSGLVVKVWLEHVYYSHWIYCFTCKCYMSIGAWAFRVDFKSEKVSRTDKISGSLITGPCSVREK